MAIHASYSTVERAVLTELMAMDEEQISDYLFDRRESGCSHEFILGSAWDGLHFLLTGASGTQALIGDALSEAIVGRERLVGDELFFVSVLRREHVRAVTEALESVADASVARQFRRSHLIDAGISPEAWFGTSSETLVEVFRLAFLALRLFYVSAEREQLDVIVEFG